MFTKGHEGGTMREFRKCVLLVFVSCILCSCAGSKSAVKYDFKKYTVTPDLYTDPPRTVAILPFSNSSSESKILVENWDKLIDNKRFDIDDEKRKTEEYLKRMFVRKAFYKHFSVKPFRDRELIAVDQLLEQHGVKWAEDLKKFEPRQLAEILEVDGLIYGEITHLNRLFLGLYSEVTVGCRLTFIDTRTDSIVWQSKEVEKSRAGGAPLSLTGLATNILSASLNMKKIWVYRVADDLFRRVVGHLPELDVAVEPVFMVTDEKIPLYQEPGNYASNIGKKITVLHAGTRLTLLEEADDWYLVRVDNGTTGWIEPKALGLVGEEIGHPFDVETGPEGFDKPDNKELAGLYDLQGMELFKDQKYEQAVESFEKAVRYDQDNAAVHVHLAWAYKLYDPSNMEAMEKVITHLEKASLLEPENVMYRYNLGLAYQEINEPEKALSEWRQCLERDPTLQNIRDLIIITEESLSVESEEREQGYEIESEEDEAFSEAYEDLTGYD